MSNTAAVETPIATPALRPWRLSEDWTAVVVGFVVSLALIWSVAIVEIWNEYRNALDYWGRYSRSLALSTAQFTEQSLTVNQLVLASMLDWIAEEGVANEADYHRIRTDQALDVALTAYLERRLAL